MGDDSTAMWPGRAGFAQADIATSVGASEAVADTVAGSAVPSTERTRSLIGARLADRYEIIRLLGRGGMGDVFLAEHVALRKPVAIKVLADRDFGTLPIGERFLQEARAASMIRHENVVDITDFGATPHGTPFYAMEYLEGEDLKALLEREGRLPWERARPILLQICRALSAAHRKGVVHRDMKPANCFRTEREGEPDFIKVVDFGIAKVMQDGVTVENLTQTGAIIGTPEYMSPEQARGGHLDARADVYSVGIMMYEMLTGGVPFHGSSFIAVLTSHLLDPPPLPSTVAPDAGLTPEIEHVVLTALEKDPNNRFQSIDALAGAIRAAGEAKPTTPMVTVPAPARTVVPAAPAAPAMESERAAVTLPSQPRPASAIGWTEPGGVLAPVAASSEPRRSRGMIAVASVVTTGLLATGIGLAALRISRDRDEPATAASIVEPAEEPPEDGPTAAVKLPTAPSAPVAIAPEEHADDPAPMPSETPTPAPAVSTAPDRVRSSVRSSPSTHKAAKATPVPPPAEPPTLPERISKDHGRAVKQSLEAAAQRCFAEQGGWVGLEVTVRIVVQASGDVDSVTVAEPQADTPAGKCIGKVVDGARFPATTMGGKVDLVFVAK